MSAESYRGAGIVAKVRKVLTMGDGIPLWLALPALVLVLMLFVSQVSTLRLQIMDEHRWREADGFAVAYNFVHDSFDFFHPRTDVTHGRSGITGMEPPILPFMTAIAMRVFGDAPSIGRVVVWLISMLGLGATVLLVRRVRDTGLAVGFLVAFMLSPMALFELRQIQPDGPTVMLAGLAAFFLHRFACTEQRRDYVLGVVAFNLSVLMKGPGLVLAPAMLCFACSARKVSLRQLVLRGAGLASPAVLYFLWTRWAAHLTHVYNADFPTFNMDFSLKGAKSALLDEKLLHHIFWYLFPSYATCWVLFPALVVGLAAAFQRRTRRVSLAFLVWLAFGSLLVAAFSPRLRIHWYYADVVLVPLAYFTGFGLSEVFRLFARDASRAPLVARWAALVVLGTLVLQRFVVPIAQKIQDTPGGDGPHQDYSWMTEGHLTMLFVVLATMMIVAQVVSSRVLVVTAFVLLPFAAYWGLWRARREAMDTLRLRTHVAEEHEFRKAYLNGLRPLVNKYSTRADLFLVSGPERADIGGDAYYLHLPLRRGWSEVRKTLAKEDLSPYREAGARFLLNFSEHELPQEKTLVKLESTPYFRLYCLDPNGCAPLARVR
jgi:4-amino-4-deoxy-L-arabinose transferase-like glycosyltransferase